jgi:hypothetical protein
MLIPYPCVTFIHYYPCLFVASLFSFLYKNSIRGSINFSFSSAKGFQDQIKLENTELKASHEAVITVHIYARPIHFAYSEKKSQFQNDS